MELKPQEKLMLLMLADLQKEPGEKEIDPDFVTEVLSSGQTWALNWRYGSVLESTQPRAETVGEVVDILDMWSFLEAAYKQLDDDERQQLQTRAEPFGRDVQFPGFDGNNETELLIIAETFTGPLNRWQSFAGRSLNSHMPSIERYRRMLAVFKPLRAEIDPMDDRLLTVEDLASVLKAQQYD